MSALAQVDGLMQQFGDMKINDVNPNPSPPKSWTKSQSRSQFQPWMKEFKFRHIVLPIHDAIFPEQIFDKDKDKHQQIFDSIDLNNDKFISKKEFMKVTSVGNDEGVIPVPRIRSIWNEITTNIDNIDKGITFKDWWKAVDNIDLSKIQNNTSAVKNDDAPVPPNNDQNNGDQHNDDQYDGPIPPNNDPNNGDQNADDQNNDDQNDGVIVGADNGKADNNDKIAKHIMKVLQAIEHVWKSLGPAHREGAYQKALMWELMDIGCRVFMERRVPLYHVTKWTKKIHLVSMERIDLFIKNPATVIELKAVSSKLGLTAEYQVKKYSQHRKYPSILANFPNNKDECEVKVWTPDVSGGWVQFKTIKYKTDKTGQIDIND